MAKRIELNFEEVENVTGGAIVWKPNGTCYAKDDPSNVYSFDINEINDIMTFLLQNNAGKAYNAETMELLEGAGYVTHVTN